MANIPIITFNTGEMTPKTDARSDVDKTRAGCRHLENMLPLIYGCVERRPGTEHIATSYNDTAVVRNIPFIYSATVAYTIELGNLYARIFYEDTVVQTIATPYLTAHLFELQFKQVADVIRIVHNSYAPRKLIRTGASTFELNVIEFTTGPFLTRNDLIDPDNPSTTTMSCSTTQVGAGGMLTASASVFLQGHAGTLFKIVQPKENTISSGSRNSVGVICDTMKVKGDFRFNTAGNWGAVIILQRRQNSASDDDWENYRTYKSVLTSGAGSRNVQEAFTEEDNNVEYRAYISEYSGGTCEADITVEESTQCGVVRVNAVINSYNAAVTVVSELASTDATRKWAEGAWSEARGYPSSITFDRGRCIYGGASLTLDEDEFIAAEYPSLRL